MEQNEKKQMAMAWIEKNIRPTKGTGDNTTGYLLKHALEQDTGLYFCVDAFSDLMAEAGYRLKRTGAFYCELTPELKRRIKRGEVMA